LVLLGLAIVFAASQLDQWVRKGLEYQLSQILDAPVTVGAVTASPWEHSVEIRDLVLNNPKTFDVGPAVELPWVSITLDPGSLFGERIEVPSIEVEKAHLHLRYSPSEGSNIGILTTRAREWRDGRHLGWKPHAYRVAKLTSTSAQMTTYALGRSATVPLADLALTDVTSERVETTGAMAATVLRKMLEEMVSAKSLVEGVGERLGEELEKWIGESPL
jgi:hypothetical protein